MRCAGRLQRGCRGSPARPPRATRWRGSRTSSAAWPRRALRATGAAATSAPCQARRAVTPVGSAAGQPCTAGAPARAAKAALPAASCWAAPGQGPRARRKHQLPGPAAWRGPSATLARPCGERQSGVVRQRAPKPRAPRGWGQQPLPAGALQAPLPVRVPARPRAAQRCAGVASWVSAQPAPSAPAARTVGQTAAEALRAAPALGLRETRLGAPKAATTEGRHRWRRRGTRRPAQAGTPPPKAAAACRGGPAT